MSACLAVTLQRYRTPGLAQRQTKRCPRLPPDPVLDLGHGGSHRARHLARRVLIEPPDVLNGSKEGLCNQCCGHRRRMEGAGARLLGRHPGGERWERRDGRWENMERSVHCRHRPILAVVPTKTQLYGQGFTVLRK